jgi:hypothetical protein
MFCVKDGKDQVQASLKSDRSSAPERPIATAKKRQTEMKCPPI